MHRKLSEVEFFQLLNKISINSPLAIGPVHNGTVWTAFDIDGRYFVVEQELYGYPCCACEVSHDNLSKYVIVSELNFHYESN